MKSFLQYLSEAKSFQPDRNDEQEMRLYDKLSKDYKYADLILQWFHRARKAGDDATCTKLLGQTGNVMDELADYDRYVARHRASLPQKVKLQASGGKAVEIGPTDVFRIRTLQGFGRFFSAVKRAAVENSSAEVQSKMTDADFKNIRVVCFDDKVVCWGTRTFESTNKFIAWVWNIRDMRRMETDSYEDPEINSPYCTRVRDHWDEYSEGDPDYEQFWFFKRVPGATYVKGDLTVPSVAAAFKESFETGAAGLACMFGSNNDWCDRNDLDLSGVDALDGVISVIQIGYDENAYESAEEAEGDGGFYDTDFNKCEASVIRLVRDNFEERLAKRRPWSKSSSFLVVSGERPDIRDGGVMPSDSIPSELTENIQLTVKDFGDGGLLSFDLPPTARNVRITMTGAPKGARLRNGVKLINCELALNRCVDASVLRQFTAEDGMSRIRINECGNISGLAGKRLLQLNIQKSAAAELLDVPDSLDQLYLYGVSGLKDLRAFAGCGYSKLYVNGQTEFRLDGCPRKLDDIWVEVPSDVNRDGTCVLEGGPTTVTGRLFVKIDRSTGFAFASRLPGRKPAVTGSYSSYLWDSPVIIRCNEVEIGGAPLSKRMHGILPYNAVSTVMNSVARTYIKAKPLDGYYDASGDQFIAMSADPLTHALFIYGKTFIVFAQETGLAWFDADANTQFDPKTLSFAPDLYFGEHVPVRNMTGLPKAVNRLTISEPGLSAIDLDCAVEELVLKDRCETAALANMKNVSRVMLRNVQATPRLLHGVPECDELMLRDVKAENLVGLRRVRVTLAVDAPGVKSIEGVPAGVKQLKIGLNGMDNMEGCPDGLDSVMFLCDVKAKNPPHGASPYDAFLKGLTRTAKDIECRHGNLPGLSDAVQRFNRRRGDARWFGEDGGYDPAAAVVESYIEEIAARMRRLM